ncbi:hypothetical protein SMALB_2729 [Streptomyces malaysiensis]|uniref:Uncharacterized protein n=1 Tax=Streptomyces malaysiensis TaxID=92644 RepID=A0A7X5X142_STRMQ|nr:hypothetical protein [Streptomyces malaysiensis]
MPLEEPDRKSTAGNAPDPAPPGPRTAAPCAPRAGVPSRGDEAVPPVGDQARNRGPGRSPTGCKGRSPLIQEGAGQGTPPPETPPTPHPQGPARQRRAPRGQAYRPEETSSRGDEAVPPVGDQAHNRGPGRSPTGCKGRSPLIREGRQSPV